MRPKGHRKLRKWLGPKNSADHLPPAPAQTQLLGIPWILSDRGSFVDLKALARGRGPFWGGGWWVHWAFLCLAEAGAPSFPFFPKVMVFMQSSVGS